MDSVPLACKDGPCDDLDLFYGQCQLISPMHLNGKNVNMSLNGETLKNGGHMDRRIYIVDLRRLEDHLSSESGKHVREINTPMYPNSK